MKQLTIILLLLGLLVTLQVQADPISELLGNDGNAESNTTEKVISTDNKPQDDDAIRERIENIYSELEDLDAIGVTVSNGVVSLTGEVEASATEEKALQLARQIEGVVEVKNGLVVALSLQRRLENTLQRISDLFVSLVGLAPLLGLALLLVAVFWWLGTWSTRRKALFRKLSPNGFIADLLSQIVRLLIVIIGIILALTLLDATSLIGTVLGAAGIIGLAVGFAVRDTVENYIASVLLSLRHPFARNDLIDIEGVMGHVARLTSRATVLISPDGNHIRIPNATVYKSSITNFTRNPKRRFEFDVGIDTAEDLLTAQAMALEVLGQVPGILADPEPFTVIIELGDFNVLVRIYAWVDQSSFNFAKVRSEAIRAVKTAFDGAGVGMPEPIYNLRISEKQSAADKPPTSESKTDKHKGRYSDSVQDLTVDRTAEEQVEAEEKLKQEDDLLNENAPSEI